MEKSVLEEVVEGESGGEARIGELGGAVVVVDEVDAARRRVAHLPAGRQRSGHGQVAQVARDPRVVPRADAAGHMVKVHLTLLRLAHLVAVGQVRRWPAAHSLLLLLLLLMRRRRRSWLHEKSHGIENNNSNNNNGIQKNHINGFRSSDNKKN